MTDPVPEWVARQFALFYLRAYDRILARARMLTAGRSQRAAEDLMHDAFVQALRHWEPVLDGLAHPQRIEWMRTTMARLAVKEHAREQRFQDCVALLYQPHFSEASGPETAALASLTWQQCWQAIKTMSEDEELAALLNVRPGGRLLRVHRLRLADGEPVSVDTSHLSARRFPGLRRQLQQHASLYETLRTDYGIHLAEAEETIESVPADPHDAQLLGVNPGAPLLLLTRHVIDSAGEPVERAQSWYRADRYKFTTRLRITPG